MRKDVALKTALAIGTVGTLFSGYLSYLDFYGGAGASCPAVSAPGTILGYPPCVYGLIMYSAITAVSASGLLRGK